MSSRTLELRLRGSRKTYLSSCFNQLLFKICTCAADKCNFDSCLTPSSGNFVELRRREKKWKAGHESDFWEFLTTTAPLHPWWSQLTSPSVSWLAIAIFLPFHLSLWYSWHTVPYWVSPTFSVVPGTWHTYIYWECIKSHRDSYPYFPEYNSEKLSTLPKLHRSGVDIRLAWSPLPPPLHRVRQIRFPWHSPICIWTRKSGLTEITCPSADSLLISFTYLLSIFLASGETVSIVLIKLSMRWNHLF